MGKSKKKKTGQSGKSHGSHDLAGFEIKINSLGEIQSNIDIDNINKFLNENLADKKLKKKKGRKSRS